jgi:hypothetical protein
LFCRCQVKTAFPEKDPGDTSQAHYLPAPPEQPNESYAREEQSELKASETRRYEEQPVVIPNSLNYLLSV